MAFRNNVISLLSKIFARIWIGINNVAQKVRRRGEATLKKGVSRRGGDVDPMKQEIENAEASHAFVSETIRTLIANMYPGSPYERRCTALELLNLIADAWKSDGEIFRHHDDLDPKHDIVVARRLLTSPYEIYMKDESFTNLLLGALVDSWERLRLTAFDLLKRHVSPLAGIETPEKLSRRLEWAVDLLHSPRVRESGAAALAIRLLIRKYMIDLNWQITLSPNVSVSENKPDEDEPTHLRVLELFRRLLEDDIEIAEKDVMKGCRRSLAHGAILVVKYTLCDLNMKCARRSKQVSFLTRSRNVHKKGDEENQAPSTELYEDNGRLNRTLSYPGQDRAFRSFRVHNFLS